MRQVPVSVESVIDPNISLDAIRLTLRSPGLKDLRPVIHQLQYNDKLHHHYPVRVCRGSKSGACLVDACRLYEKEQGFLYIREGFYLVKNAVERIETMKNLRLHEPHQTWVFGNDFDRQSNGDFKVRYFDIRSREIGPRGLGCVYIIPEVVTYICENEVRLNYRDRASLDVLNDALRSTSSKYLLHEPFFAAELPYIANVPNPRDSFPAALFDADSLDSLVRGRCYDFLVVTTCPRPDGVSYLEGTLNQLNQAGADEMVNKLVFSDGPLPHGIRERFTSWNFFEYDGPSGTKKALWRVFKYFDGDPSDFRLLLIEDDVIACRNAINRMLMTEIPDGMAAVTFFDLRETDASTPWGIHRRKLKRKSHQTLWGLQAVLFEGGAVRFLAKQDPESIDYLQSSIHQSDVALSELLAEGYHRQHFGVHVPNLFEHCGDVSAWGNQKKHRSPFFPGVEFNALTIPEPEVIDVKVEGLT